MSVEIRLVSGLRRLLWLHPESWLLALTGVAWMALMFDSGPHHHEGTSTAATFAGMSLRHAALMTLAMMGPLVIVPIRTAAFKSFWRRRHVAVACVATGYLGTWLLFAMTARAMWLGVQPPIEEGTTAAVILAIAAAWQVSAGKARALRRCYPSMPLTPRGWRAERDCIQLGVAAATRCARVTWPVMLLAVVAPDRLSVMVGVTTLCAFERYTLFTRLYTRAAAALFGIGAAISLAVSLWR